MKKTFLTSLLVLSQIALVGCDSREKDTLTFEVAVVDLEGKTQTFKQDCKHTQFGCRKQFPFKTPNGEEKISIGLVNDPTEENYDKAMAQARTKTMKEVDEGAIVLSEYSQRIYGIAGQKIKDFKAVKNWKPGTKREESFDLALRDGTKVGTAKVKVY